MSFKFSNAFISSPYAETHAKKHLKKPIEFEGVGLHNGIRVNLFLKPAEVNSGIKFKRTDIDNTKNIIEANYKNVSSAILCTKNKKFIWNISFYY